MYILSIEISVVEIYFSLQMACFNDPEMRNVDLYIFVFERRM